MEPGQVRQPLRLLLVLLLAVLVLFWGHVLVLLGLSCPMVGDQKRIEIIIWGEPGRGPVAPGRRRVEEAPESDVPPPTPGHDQDFVRVVGVGLPCIALRGAFRYGPRWLDLFPVRAVV